MNISNYITIMKRYEEEKRIHKIGAAWTFTNSEMLEMGCFRKWTYGYVMNQNADEKSSALLYGIVWHEILEHILIRIKNTDKCITTEEAHEICDTIGLRSFNEQQEYISVPEEAQDQYIEEEIKKIKRAIVGWLQHWDTIHQDYEIIGIEQVLARPVYIPGSEDIYAPSTKVIQQDDTLYPIGVNNKNNDHQTCSIPYWKVGKADAILLKRGTKSLYILDHKTTSSPNQYSRRFLFDMQLASYCSLLQYEIQNGEMQQWKDYDVKGVIWDLCHSKIPEPPKPLKSGKLSTSISKFVPSWIYEESIKINDLDINDYREHLEMLKTKADPTYFQFLITSISESEMNRSSLEDYAAAKRMNELRTELEITDDIKFQYTATRYPICQQYMSCKFSYICQPNVPLSDIEEKENTNIYWKKIENNTDYDIINSDQLGLPF